MKTPKLHLIIPGRYRVFCTFRRVNTLRKIFDIDEFMSNDYNNCSHCLSGLQKWKKAKLIKKERMLRLWHV